MNHNESSAAFAAAQVVIVGAGISGLISALYLERAGISCVLIDKAAQVGGRAGTISKNGFLLDVGFQVYLDSYEEFERVLDKQELDLGYFRSGAFIWNGDKLIQFTNPLQEPWSILHTLLSPWAGIIDKVLMARLLYLARNANQQLQVGELKGVTTKVFLQKNGISDRAIQTFFKPFFGDVFLDRSLGTDAQFFLYLFSKFTTTKASLPLGGLGAISKLLASKLKSPIILSTEATIQEGQVAIQGLTYRPTYIIDATSRPSRQAGRPWQAAAVAYYAASVSPLRSKLLILNAKDGLVRSLAVLSDVQKGYAPDGQSLISISINPFLAKVTADLDQSIRQELMQWLGPQVKSWTHVDTLEVKQALPAYEPPWPEPDGYKVEGNTVLCGDIYTYPSLNGAALSGRRAAEFIIARQAG